MMVSHVDDFLDGGNEFFKDNVMQQITSKFKIGKDETLRFRYIGVNVTETESGIYVDQDQFINELDPVKFEMDDSVKDRPLNRGEQRSYRRVVGQLNWLVSTTRPDLAFDTLELSVMLKSPDVACALLANKLVRRAKMNKVHILFPRIKVDKNLRILTISDAAFANLLDKVSSGAGYVILLVDNDRKCSPLMWVSNKIQRVVNSTIAAEMLSLLNAVKEAQYLRAVLRELLGESVPLPIDSIVDSRNVKLALCSTKKIEDKRLRIDVATIKQDIERGDLRDVIHVKGSKMIADCMTKRGASPKHLIETLCEGKLPDFLS
jgi:hypothetical protein